MNDRQDADAAKPHGQDARATLPTRSRATRAELADPGKPQRLVSLDACRGAIMLLMASSGLGLAQVAKQFTGRGESSLAPARETP